MKRKFLKEILEFSVYVLIVLILTLCVVRFVGQRFVVNGSSMEQTLSDGDNLIINKISYRFSDPKRFDVVVFPFKYTENTNYIKRVIGLPGETVRIDDTGNIYINGAVLTESYGTEAIKDAGLAAEEITLGADEYFVLGDNRNNSVDSRDPSVGIVKKDTIIGKPWIRIYPFNRFGSVS